MLEAGTSDPVNCQLPEPTVYILEVPLEACRTAPPAGLTVVPLPCPKLGTCTLAVAPTGTVTFIVTWLPVTDNDEATVPRTVSTEAATLWSPAGICGAMLMVL